MKQESLIDSIIAENNLTAKQTLILETAIKLFAENGYANTSTNEIVKDAGVSEGSLFKKFKSKKGLLTAIIDPLTQSILPSVFQDVSWQLLKQNSHDLRTIIKMIVYDRLNFIEHNIEITKIFFGEALYSKDIRDDIFRNLPIDLINDLDQVIDKLKEEKVLVDWANSEIINFLAYNIVGFALKNIILFDITKDDLKERIRNLIDLLVNGLSPLQV